MKECTKCRTVKDHSEFYKSKQNKWRDGIGLSGHCKQCIKNRKDNDPTFKDRTNEYRRERCKYDPNFKLSINLRSRFLKALKNNQKTGSAIDLLGCSIDDFRKHIESKFADGMSWENHSLHGWHIDHIRPCASFDLSKPEDQKACFHWSNMQPLWAEENQSKHAKVE